MSEIKVNSIKGVAASAAAITVDNTNGTCTLASGSKLNNCTTDGTTSFTIADGNLVIGTSGHGIDFGATSGTGDSEILTDYEQGTFNAPYYEGGTLVTNADGRYTKVGNRVFISVFEFAYGGASNKDILYITGLPFAARSEPNSVGMICRYSGGNHQTIAASETCYIAQGGTQIKFDGNFPSGSGNWTLSLVYETDA